MIAGIWPLKSYRNAQFMAHEVPGVFVPRQIVDRMESCKSGEDQVKMGLEIAHEIIEVVCSRLPAPEAVFVFIILRITYGYHRKYSTTTIKSLAKLLNLSMEHIYELVHRLTIKRVISVEWTSKSCLSVSFNKN